MSPFSCAHYTKSINHCYGEQLSGSRRTGFGHKSDDLRFAVVCLWICERPAHLVGSLWSAAELANHSILSDILNDKEIQWARY